MVKAMKKSSGRIKIYIWYKQHYEMGSLCNPFESYQDKIKKKKKVLNIIYSLEPSQNSHVQRSCYELI